MQEFQEDAYVEEAVEYPHDGCLPEGLGHYWIMIDIIQDDGSVQSVIIMSAESREAAECDVETLNKWRDQTRFDK